MILSDKDIIDEIKAGRIVFSPKIGKEQIGGASVDLTLAPRFWKFKPSYEGKVIDLKRVHFSQSFDEIKARSIVLHPGELCLAITREKIKLAPDIMGNLEGRSRYARMGLAVHITSALVQPGSDNHQVLEVVNFAPFAVKLHAGMRISQVVFEYIRTPTSQPYAKYGKIARGQ
ncbi:dCTP deaminase [Candidatus Micrarchaeota archaeon CG10_big_fil_rev_8_21_14_0_10_45_29]|nr:MAG: dCTP deaminase [Candidatus Micrarchaeota archaeon CG10_big_fil_rev_8_21_14_0_10_45_29]